MGNSERDFTPDARANLESRLHSCRSNGLRARPLYWQLQGDISDIVPDVQSDFEVIERYYGEIRRAISQCFSDISCVYQQAWQTEGEFVLALDRENRKAQHLRDALKALNKLIDPRRVGNCGGSLIQLCPNEFSYYAAKVETALIAKLFEAMVVRDDRGKIVDFRWDIIGGILDKDYVDISERQLAALAKIFTEITAIGGLERFLNLLADQVELSDIMPTGFVSRGIDGAAVVPGVLAFIFCPDKVAGLQRHLDFILAGESSEDARHGIIQRIELLNGVMFAKSGESIAPVLWGDSNGPIRLREGTLTFETDGVVTTIEGIKINVIAGTYRDPFLAGGAAESISRFTRQVMVSDVHENQNITSAVSNLIIEGGRIRYQVNPAAIAAADTAKLLFGFTKVGAGAGKGMDALSIVDGLLGGTQAEANRNVQRNIDTLEAKNTALFMRDLNFDTVTISCSRGDLMISGRPSPATGDSVDGFNNSKNPGRDVTRDEVLNSPQIPLDNYLRHHGISR